MSVEIDIFTIVGEGQFVRQADYETLRRQLAEAEEKAKEDADLIAIQSANFSLMKERRDAAEAKLVLAEQDARRYRWLRDSAADSTFGPCLYGGYPTSNSGLDLFTGDAADTAIDAAIAAGEGK